MFDSLLSFVAECAAPLFGPTLGARSTLERIKAEFVAMAPYLTAAQRYVASKPELHALAHANLQIDNAFFWRASDERDPDKVRLECGLLDWYNVSRAPAAGVWMLCLSGVEPDVLARHEEGLMRCYSEEFHKYGGALLDPNELRLQFRLSFCATFVGNLQFIETDIKREGPSRAEWAKITDRWDELIMGRFNVRCRVIAIMQLLAFYEAVPVHATFMEWVNDNPELCAPPST